MFVERQPR